MSPWLWPCHKQHNPVGNYLQHPAKTSCKVRWSCQSKIKPLVSQNVSGKAFQRQNCGKTANCTFCRKSSQTQDVKSICSMAGFAPLLLDSPFVVASLWKVKRLEKGSNVGLSNFWVLKHLTFFWFTCFAFLCSCPPPWGMESNTKRRPTSEQSQLLSLGHHKAPMPQQ